MKNFKQQAALNRVLSIIQAIDDERFHWMLNDVHYNYKKKGHYDLVIWIDTSEKAITLQRAIETLIMKDDDTIETKECDSEDTPYIIAIKTQY